MDEDKSNPIFRMTQIEWIQRALQVKIGRHPNELELRWESNTLGGRVRPNRALQHELPVLRVDDLELVSVVGGAEAVPSSERLDIVSDF
jgi:hypothetical protein